MKSHRFVKTALSLALALVPLAVHAQSDAAPTRGAGYTLWKLHQIDELEIKLGELARSNASSPAVKSYADKLVSDHTAADTKVKAQAKTLHVDLDATPASAADKAAKAKHDALADQLKSLTGGDFDAKYTQSMMDGHKEAIDFVTTARADSSQAQIKPLLDELLPQLREHEQIAMRLGNGHQGMSAPPQGRRPGGT